MWLLEAGGDLACALKEAAEDGLRVFCCGARSVGITKRHSPYSSRPKRGERWRLRPGLPLGAGNPGFLCISLTAADQLLDTKASERA